MFEELAKVSESEGKEEERRERLLDELALCYARAAVDRALREEGLLPPEPIDPTSLQRVYVMQDGEWA